MPKFVIKTCLHITYVCGRHLTDIFAYTILYKLMQDTDDPRQRTCLFLAHTGIHIIISLRFNRVFRP